MVNDSPANDSSISDGSTINEALLQKIAIRKNGTSAVSVVKVDSSLRFEFADVLAVEEPLEIRLSYEANQILQQKSISITMRTPGHDFELAAGFLFTEGLIQFKSDVTAITYCGPALSHLGHSNTVKVELAPGRVLDLKSLERHFYTSSSCGVCGKSSIEALKTKNLFSQVRDSSGPSLSSKMILSLPEKLRAAQTIFDQTGGLHASALFSAKGELIALREDVGRHNALDKLIGAAFLQDQIPLRESALLLSGRISYELVQKASMAGIRLIAAVGAPSSLALELAQEMNMTLIGFIRGQKFNIYTGEWRVL